GFDRPAVGSAAPGPPAVAVGPAAVVPVAAQVGCLVGDGDDVAGAPGNVLVAPRAQVGLGRLVRLDAADLDVVVSVGVAGARIEGHVGATALIRGTPTRRGGRRRAGRRRRRPRRPRASPGGGGTGSFPPGQYVHPDALPTPPA